MSHPWESKGLGGVVGLSSETTRGNDSADREPESAPIVAVVIACDMLEEEVESMLQGLEVNGGSPPVVWAEAAFEDSPADLLLKVDLLVRQLDEGARRGQETVLEHPWLTVGCGRLPGRPVVVGPTGNVLIAFGCCRQHLQGIVSINREVVFTRSSVCVPLALEAGCPRKALSSRWRGGPFLPGILPGPRATDCLSADGVAP
jgi:hypothetical protein